MSIPSGKTSFFNSNLLSCLLSNIFLISSI